MSGEDKVRRGPLEVSCPHQLKDLSDRALLGLYRRAPDEATAEQIFNAIYARHSSASWNFIFYRSQTQEDAEDIFAETWEAVYTRILSLDLRKSLRGWIIGIAKHKIAGYYPPPKKKSSQGGEIPIQTGTTKSIASQRSLDAIICSPDKEEIRLLIEAIIPADKPNPQQHPVHMALRNEEIDLLVNEALSKLGERSPTSLDVVILSFFVGLTDREIAETLEMKSNAVRTAKTRALRKYLPEIINDILQEMGEGIEWFEYLR